MNRRRALEVFAALAVLTALSAGATYAIADRGLLRAVLVGLAAAKASLVALFFMHLRYERALVWSLVAIPAAIAAAFVAGIVPDIGYPLR